MGWHRVIRCEAFGQLSRRARALASTEADQDSVRLDDETACMPGDPDRENRFPAGDPVVSSDFVPPGNFCRAPGLTLLSRTKYERDCGAYGALHQAEIGMAQAVLETQLDELARRGLLTSVHRRIRRAARWSATARASESDKKQGEPEPAA